MAIIILIIFVIIGGFVAASMINKDPRFKGSSSTSKPAPTSRHTSTPKSPTVKFLPKPNIKMLEEEGDIHEDEYHTYIAGLHHYIAYEDVGGFSGYVVADPNNAFDNKAMAVCNDKMKILGYIPAKELDDYRDWSDAKPLPCVGFIFIEDKQIRGRVKVLHPCNEQFLQDEFSRYLQWVNDNYGSAYLPKDLKIEFEAE